MVIKILGALRAYSFFAVWLLAQSSYSQIYNFKTFSVEHGLPESRINNMYEDQRGNLWIATAGAGLLRFDGYSFTSYHQEDGLINNFIHSIYEDHTGKLWVGTDEGLCTYNGTRFTKVKFLEKETITAIVQDASDRFWFGTRASGLYQFDGKTLTGFAKNKREFLSQSINCLYLDKHSTLWIGTSSGVVQYNRQNFKSYRIEDGLPSNSIRGIAEDNLGNLWFATDEGVSKFDRSSFYNYTTQNGFRSHHVYSVLQDDKKNLWFGTSDGIVKYDGSSFQHYETKIGQRNNVITCIYKDTEGNLWFGSSGNGLSKLDSERFINYPENDQMGKRVYSVVQAINGNIICGTSLGGTTVFDGKQFSLLNKQGGFTSSIVQSFYYGHDSTLWVGTQDEGLYKFSKSNITKFTTKEGLVSNNVTGFVMDDNINNMWIATADSGVSVIQTLKDSLYVVKKYNKTNGLSSNKISSIAYDHAGTVWIGTEDMGINKIKASDTLTINAIEQVTTQQGLNSNAIQTILIDSLHHVYIGTNQGISIYDGKRFFSITKKDGLGSNTVYALGLDNQHNLWAGTERGVDMITFAGKFDAATIRHFDSNEGFKGLEVYRNSSCVDKKGNVWFGTVNGLVKYNPSEELEATVTPKIHITGVKLFFDKIEDTKYADSVSAWYSIPLELSLPYRQNNLTFSFVGIHLRNPQAVRYKWILEGFSKDWSPVGTDRTATFSNLPPGSYTFKVMACNEYNVWNDTPAIFKFSIEPPFWQRWWAITAAAILIIVLIWAIFHIRVQQINAKNKIIQERLEMEKSILELEQEAARLQMNPHFIFNALNSIQGFISINDQFQAKKYLAKFGKLMRLILENAREEFIPLQNEINILDNYLELERLSSNHKFDFFITMDSTIDSSIVQIPPMMIQPFVENAVLHGIKKKEGMGVVNIHFNIVVDLVECVIHDNGIGRKKSGLINGQSRPNHKSTGVYVTQKRLEQYGSYRKVKSGIQFIDLEEHGNATGTKVIISIPFEAS